MQKKDSSAALSLFFSFSLLFLLSLALSLSGPVKDYGDASD